MPLVGRRIRAFSDFVAARPAGVILGVLIALSLLRTGFAIWNWFLLSPQLLTDWGSPNNAFQSNLLFNAFGTAWLHLVGSPDGFLWLALQALIAIISVAIITTLVYRRTADSSQYLAAAVVLSSGIAAVLWREIGRYDFIFLVAVAVAFLCRRQAWMWLAVIIAAFSAPEQAALAGIAALLLTLTPPFAAWRRQAWALLGAALAAIVLVQAWFALAGDFFATRVGLMLAVLTGQPVSAPSRFDAGQGAFAVIFQKFYEGLANGFTLFWSYLGAALIALVIVALTLPRSRSLITLIFAVLIFPLATTLFFGEDPTRDLVIVGAPMILMITIVASQLAGGFFANLAGGATAWLTWSTVLVTVLPMVFIFVYPEAPFDFAVHMLISWNNGVEIDWSGNAR